MTISTFIALLPMMLGLAAVPGAEVQPAVRRMVIDDQLIVRVPVRPLPPPRFVWVPAQGLKCIPVGAIRGAMLSGRQQVDMLLPNRRRVRARFSDDCPALDFYEGFYLKPTDARLCAGRDELYSRIGGSCRIQRLQLLVPRLRR